MISSSATSMGTSGCCATPLLSLRSVSTTVFSLGDLVDRGPDSWAAIDWITGTDAALRFDVVVRGNHEQLMLEGCRRGGARRRKNLSDAWIAWQYNGGAWWNERETPPSVERAWSVTLGRLPYCARVEPGGDGVDWCMQVRCWRGGKNWRSRCSRTERSPISPAGGRYGVDIGTATCRPACRRPGRKSTWGPWREVECVITGHTPVCEPVWQENVLAIDTGVYTQGRGYGRLTIARIDGKELEIVSFQRREERCEGGLGRRERDTV